MNTIHHTIEAREIAKSFGKTVLFKNISLSLSTGESCAVTGPNGSGKSTLLMILTGLQSPTRGSVIHAAATGIERAHWLSHIGYTGPLVNPYDDLTAIENIMFAGNNAASCERIDSLLEQFNLAGNRHKMVRHYSSGMKQRLKLVLAVLNDSPVLVLDEPGTNLDAAGKDTFHSYIESVRATKIIIIATNDRSDEALCGGGIRLG